MCGIVGIVGTNAAADRARFTAARDLMWSRGPDDGGVWQAPGVTLGARRLAIVDLSPAGHQPMVSADGRVTIVFNGEIYNCPELRREIGRDFEFRSHTDTEVLLHGYRRWGLRGLLDRADGMFAFAIWDADRRRLVAARDRAGKKPFFYSHQGPAFYFASVQRVLQGILPGTATVDPHALDAYLVYQAVPSPLSFFAGVRQLPPAHALTFDAESGSCRLERYWHLSFRHKTTETEDQVVEHVTSLVRAGVRKRLVADVPVGVFLSGGVDSSLVTCLAAEESGRAIDAVTLGFAEPAFDERQYARLVAARAGVTLHEEVLRPEVVSDLPAIVGEYCQPVADVSIVPNHYLAQAAVRTMRVALNGDGGDELFGGYARPMLEWMVGPYRDAVPAGIRHGIDAGLTRYRGQHLRRAAMLAHAGASTARDAFVYDRAYRPWREAAYAPALRIAVADWDPDALYGAAWDGADAGDDVDRALAGDFSTYLPDQLLTKADRASMAHSLEARSPLLDTAVMEYAATIPNEMRFRRMTTKYVLKRVAAQFVPAEAIYRRKRGFVMPASAWLRGALAPYARAALDNRTFFDRGWMRPEFVRNILEEHFSGIRDWGEQIFTLLVLEAWARIVLDRTLDRDAKMDAFLSSPGRGPRTLVRTLQVGMEWFPELPGGLNRVYYELARHLPDVGVSTHGIVAGAASVATGSQGRIEGIAPIESSLPVRMTALYRRGRALVRGDTDRLVVSHFPLYAYPLLGALNGRPLVVHFQGPWALESRAEGHSGLTVAAKLAVERAVYKRATAFIVLSAPFGRILEEQFGVPAARIHVVPGGVDAERFAIADSRAACRERLGWPGDRKIVLTVRRLARRMGLDSLIAAVSQLREREPSVLVLIAGVGSIAGELEARIRELGVQDHVRLVGFIPDDLLVHAYRAADLSIVPSVALEGFGLIVAESLAAGTPCLVTPVGGLPEAVQGLSPRLVLAGCEPADLADGIADALSGVTPLPSSAQCADFARANFDWPVIASRVREVYEGALR